MEGVSGRVAYGRGAIASSGEGLESSVVFWRRLFHSRPEIGWCEYWTTARITEILQGMGLEPAVGCEIMSLEDRLGLPSMEERERSLREAASVGASQAILDRMKGGTGLYVDLAPEKEPGVCVRCDIDALPVLESEDAGHAPLDKGFRSGWAGCSHACGHDGHMAIALGLASLLAPLRGRLSRNVRILFQPAEEGVRGAESMKRLVAGYPLLFAYHIGLSCQESGVLVTGASGAFATTKFDVGFFGREAHAAQAPEQGRDALKAACEAALALHALPRCGTGEGRICVGRLGGGSARNVIPGHSWMECEVRGRPGSVNDFLFEEACRVVRGAAVMNGVEETIELRGRAESLESDESLARELKLLAEKMAAEGKVSFKRIETTAPMNVSEDAATLMRAVQDAGGRAAYMLFGSRLAAGHHARAFDFDESILAPAARFLFEAVSAYAVEDGCES